MKRHLSDVEIELYRKRTCSPQQLIEFNEHVFECDECSQHFESPEKIRSAYEYLKNDLESARFEHLDYRELQGYVNGTLDAEDRENVLDHIRVCGECREDINEMAAIRTRIEEGNKPKPTKREKAARILKTHGPGFSLGIFGAVVAVSIIFWIHSSRTGSRVDSLENAVSRLEHEKRDLQLQAEKAKARLRAGNSQILQDGGRQIAVDENGKLQGLETIPPSYEPLLKEALSSGRVSVPAPPETKLGKVGTLLGGNGRTGRFDVVHPVGTAVLDTRPVFQWQRLSSATSYTVILKDLVSGAEYESKPTTKTSWSIETQLIRGHQYVWMVLATAAEKSLRAPGIDRPYATFRILQEDEAQEVLSIQKQWGSSHLVMGLIYAKAGLMREAEQEFKDLAAANPDSKAARSLLSSVEISASRFKSR